MRLLVSVPTGVVLDETTTRVSGVSDRGSFTLLPRHADGAMLIQPGLMSYDTSSSDVDADEVFLAVDEGVLVKVGEDVRVACRRAVVAGDLENARTALAEHLSEQDEHETRARAALMSLEAEVLRRLGGLG